MSVVLLIPRLQPDMMTMIKMRTGCDVQRLCLRVQIHITSTSQPVRIFIIVIMSGCRRGISRTTLISAFSHYFLYQTVIWSLVQCNLDYPDSLGPNKTVRISYSPDKRGRFIHSGIGMGLVSMFG